LGGGVDGAGAGDDVVGDADDDDEDEDVAAGLV